MDYTLKIPKEHPQFDQLQEVISSLLVIVPAEAVYVSQDDDNYSPTFITLILTNNLGESSAGFQRVSQKIQQNFPDFIFKFLEAEEMTRGFSKGNVYLIRHCNMDCLSYYEPGHKMFYPALAKPKRIYDRAIKRFNKRRAYHFNAFGKATEQLNSNNTLEAAANLYKSLWSMYGCYLALLTEDAMEDLDYVNFNIYFLRITKAYPILKKLLDLDNPQDKEMMETLCNAHECILEGKVIEQVDNSILERAVQKFDPLEDALSGIFYEYIEYGKIYIKCFKQRFFSNRSVLTDRVLPNYLLEHALTEISDIITVFLKTRALYCFCYETKWVDDNSRKNYTAQLPGYHFYLLLLNGEHKENAVLLLQALIRRQFNDKYTVTILSHRVQYLRKQSHNQQYFFNLVMSNGLKVYEDPVHPIYPLKIEMVRDIEFTKNYWNNRMIAAESFLATAQNEKMHQPALIINALLQQAVQQIIMALLDLFLSYHPNIYSTKYMLRLAECIPGVEPLFDNSERDRKLRQLLSSNIDMIKHNDLDKESIEDSCCLYTRCQDFYDMAGRLGQRELERLENLDKSL